eukprot:scaffold222685_cov26-Tisochrysis_lutea.AAC.1
MARLREACSCALWRPLTGARHNFASRERMGDGVSPSKGWPNGAMESTIGGLLTWPPLTPLSIETYLRSGEERR